MRVYLITGHGEIDLTDDPHILRNLNWADPRILTSGSALALPNLRTIKPAEEPKMVKTTRKQREALFNVFRRDFPNWLTPTTRRAQGVALADSMVIKVPSIQWRKFRSRVQPGPGCLMVEWHGMWLGIEPDGYTHS